MILTVNTESKIENAQSTAAVFLQNGRSARPFFIKLRILSCSNRYICSLLLLLKNYSGFYYTLRLKK